MELAQQLDDYGKPAWITAMVVAFIVFWPLGLAVLGYMIWSGRMGCGNQVKRKSRMWGGMCGRAARHDSSGDWDGKSSGNAAFDEYRSDTLKRLEDEFEAFQEFLEQLRMAKDKEEFDKFMTTRKQASDGDTAAPTG